MSSTASDDHTVIPSLDGIRAVSVLLVLFPHAGYGHIVPGGLGVTIFFFLSGYLITTLMLGEHNRTGEISILNFYIRRAFRLLPPLFITLAIAYALTWSGNLRGGISLNGFLAQVFYFANYYALFFDPGNTIPAGTGVLWSLAVEEHFYIFYPALMVLLLGLPLERRSIAILFAVTCVAVLAWRFHLIQAPGFLMERNYSGSDTRIDSILYGCILALAFNPMQGQQPSSPASGHGPMTALDWALLAAALALLLVTLIFRSQMFRETIRYSLQGLALMPIFYFAIRNSNRFPFTLLNLPWLARIGVYSYAIYLIHHVVILWIMDVAPWVWRNKPLLLVSSLVLSIAYAAAIDRWVDPYFRALRRHYRSRASARPVTAASRG